MARVGLYARLLLLTIIMSNNGDNVYDNIHYLFPETIGSFLRLPSEPFPKSTQQAPAAHKKFLVVPNPARQVAGGTDKSMASPCSTDGGATHVEARVAASDLAATFAEAPARGVPGLSIMEVLTQRAAFGDPLDDLVIAGQLDDGTRSKLHLQVKNERAFTGALTEFLISELDSISGLLSRKKRRSMDSLGERHRKMSIPIAGGNHSPDPEAVRFPAAWLSVSQRRWGAGIRQT